MDLSSCPTLEFAQTRLEQLASSHVNDLAAVVAEEGMQELWFTSIPAPTAVGSEIERRLELQDQGLMAPYAIIDARSGRAVGATTLMNIDAVNRRVEIGSTFLAPSAQGTGINPAAKFMLLSRAFEDLKCIAVEFRTHWHNQASRAAISRLGAKQDGVLRSHMFDPATQSLRDTVVFSILPHEWPAVRANLLARLRRHGLID